MAEAQLCKQISQLLGNEWAWFQRGVAYQIVPRKGAGRARTGVRLHYFAVSLSNPLMFSGTNPCSMAALDSCTWKGGLIPTMLCILLL